MMNNASVPKRLVSVASPYQELTDTYLKIQGKEGKLQRNGRNEGRQTHYWKTGTEIGWRMNSCTNLQGGNEIQTQN